jgi:uncharacterized membrane protein YtjA (UPF0391 family)
MQKMAKRLLLSFWGSNPTQDSQKGITMLYYALVFLLIALFAGALGFGGIAFAAAGIAKIFFVVFLVLFILGMAAHLSHRGV